MHIEQLVTMANDIANFFSSEPTPEEGAAGVAMHMRRYWEPRMRKQIIEHYGAGGAGLNNLALAAVATLAKESVAA